MRTSAASASKFPIKRRADFIVSTAAMLSDPESLSDAEAFVGFFRDVIGRLEFSQDHFRKVTVFASGQDFD